MTFLKAAEGRTVHLPDGTPLPNEGMDLEDSLFIRRRIADGDLVAAEGPADTTPETFEPAPDQAADPAESKKPKGGK